MKLRLFSPSTLTLSLGLSLLLSSGCSRSKPADGASAPAVSPSPAAAAPAPQPALNHVVMETDKGTIEFDLLADVAPKTAENFRLLTQRGYYNGLTFHRIVKDFMLQGGDPEGDGRGGESAWGKPFDDEIDRRSPLYREGYKRGSVAMANKGPNTNGSQFFIVQKDYPLPPSYTIFGKVTRGIEVVDALADTPTTRGMDGNMSKPVTPPVIKKVTLVPVPKI